MMRTFELARSQPERGCPRGLHHTPISSLAHAAQTARCSPVAVLAQLPAMVRMEQHGRVGGLAERVQLIQDPADLKAGEEKEKEKAGGKKEKGKKGKRPWKRRVSTPSLRLMWVQRGERRAV